MAQDRHQAGEDIGIDFNLGFDDDTGGKSAHGESSFGAVPPERPRQDRAQRAAPPPPSDDDFDLDSLPELGHSDSVAPPAALHEDDFGDVGHHGTAPVAEFGHVEDSFGQDDPVEDFDAVPTHAAHHDDEFASEESYVEAENAMEDDRSEDDNEDPDNVLNSRAEEEDDAPQERSGKSLLSKLALPAGVVAVLGVGAYFGWGMVAPLIGMGDGATTQQAQATLPRNNIAPLASPAPAARNMAPPTTGLPPEQQSQSVAPGPLAPIPPKGASPLPMPPVQQASAPPAAVAPVQAAVPPLGASVPAPLQASPVQVAQPVQVAPSAMGVPPTAMNRPDDNMMRDVVDRIGKIGNDVQRVSSRIDVIEKSGMDLRADLGRRMDALDARTAAAASNAKPIPAGVRPPGMPAAPVLAAVPVQAVPSAPVKPARVAKADADPDSDAEVERPAKRRSASRSERRRAAPAPEQDSEDRSEAGGDEPQSKPRVIGGYRLQGVSEVGGRSIAVVRTRNGLEEVAMGRNLPGAGEVRSIRQSGGKWVIVTSRGVIVE